MSKYKVKLIITCNLDNDKWGFSELLQEWEDFGYEVSPKDPETHKALCNLVNEDLSAAMKDSIWDFEITKEVSDE